MFGQVSWKIVLASAVLVTAGIPTAANPVGAVSETSHNQDSIGNYNFGYNVHHRDGQQQFRQESRDFLGRVVGSYGLAEPDGRQRVVDYVADHNGFRARVRSNEPGLQGMDSAGVRIVKPEDVPPPLLLPMDHRLGQGSEVIRVPYNSGGPPAENPSRWGETVRAFPPLTPDKPYITQSEGLYIPPQAVDDLVFSPTATGRFETFQKSPLGFSRSAKLKTDTMESSDEQHFDSLFTNTRIEYPSSVFSLPNSDDRYGPGRPTHTFRYRVVQIPNGIQAVPEIDPTGSNTPFPSANDIFSDVNPYYPRGDHQRRQNTDDRPFSSRDQQQDARDPQPNPEERPYIRNENFSPFDQQQRQDFPRSRPYPRQREYQRPQPRGDNFEVSRPEDHAEYGRRLSPDRARDI